MQRSSRGWGAAGLCSLWHWGCTAAEQQQKPSGCRQSCTEAGSSDPAEAASSLPPEQQQPPWCWLQCRQETSCCRQLPAPGRPSPAQQPLDTTPGCCCCPARAARGRPAEELLAGAFLGAGPWEMLAAALPCPAPRPRRCPLHSPRGLIRLPSPTSRCPGAACPAHSTAPP